MTRGERFQNVLFSWILALGLASSTPARATSTNPPATACPQEFSALVDLIEESIPISSEHARAYLQNLITKNYSDVPETFKLESLIHSKAVDPQVFETIMSLSALKPEDREAVLQLLHAKPPQSPDLHELFKLGLYDSATWKSFLEKMAQGPAHKEYLKYFIGIHPLFQSMPEALRAQIRSSIPHLFELAEFPGKAHGRREIEAVIRLVLDPGVSLKSEIAKDPARIRDAYTQFLAKQRDLLPDEVRKQPTFSADEIIQLGRQVQETLKTMDPKSLELIRQSGKAPEVLIVGSLPNGRSIAKKSDLDILTDFEDYLGEKRTDAFLDALKARIHEVMGHRLEGASLPVTHDGALTHESFYIRSGSVALRVTPEKVILRVYSERKLTPHFSAARPAAGKPAHYSLPEPDLEKTDFVLYPQF